MEQTCMWVNIYSVLCLSRLKKCGLETEMASVGVHHCRISSLLEILLSLLNYG